MLHRVSALRGRSLEATDGEVGSIRDVYFDDERWGVRYLVVRTGSWLDQRDVLLSPASLAEEPGAQGPVRANLTREQVRHAPSVDEDKPVSRLYEAAHARHYRYPFYWTGPYLWGGGMYPGLPPVDPLYPEEAQTQSQQEARDAELDVAEHSHLRSCAEVRGYKAEAVDGAAGHVDDFVLDTQRWAVAHLIVDTRNWWPGGEVLVEPSEVERIDWNDQSLRLRLSREEARHRPPAAGAH